MASKVYDEALRGIAAGEIDLNAHTFKARLCMTNTTCDTEQAATVSAFSTIDAADATGYADVSLATLAVNRDDTNHRAEFDADDVVFSGLSGNATRDYQGVLIYKFITNDAGSVPICFIDFTADVSKAATSVTVPWNAEGILQFAQA